MKNWNGTMRQDLKAMGLTWEEALQQLPTEMKGVKLWPSVS